MINETSYWPLSGKNLGNVSKELRAIYGEDVIAVRCIDLIKDINNYDIIFIDGLRSKEEVKIFRKIWKFPIIAIIIDEERRRKLLLERTRSDDPISLNEIKKREEREEKFGIVEVIKSVDYQIVNDGNKEALKKKTRSLVKKIIENY
ncbi:MAG: hypothetical protein P8Y97_18560 [Candidatus Lokiarchaeota archaeon]